MEKRCPMRREKIHAALMLSRFAVILSVFP